MLVFAKKLIGIYKMLVKYSENMSITYFSKTHYMVNAFGKQIWYKNELIYRKIGPSEIYMEKAYTREVWVNNNKLKCKNGSCNRTYYDCPSNNEMYWFYDNDLLKEEEYWNK